MLTSAEERGQYIWIRPLQRRWEVSGTVSIPRICSGKMWSPRWCWGRVSMKMLMYIWIVFHWHNLSYFPLAAMLLSIKTLFFFFFDQLVNHTIYAEINRENFTQYHNNKVLKRLKNKIIFKISQDDIGFIIKKNRHIEQHSRQNCVYENYVRYKRMIIKWRRYHLSYFEEHIIIWIHIST